MVQVAGFPRACYPPDSVKHGKTPSADGPDITAYKRTVSRAGRWPWQTFDDSFSNGFSHGTGGNVMDSGIAGVQRQLQVEATGWIGEKTFNGLRSIRIPDGLPNAGQMAMDATAAKLIDQAYKLFGGGQDQDGSMGRVALAKAITQLGYKESPAGSNHNKYGEWYGVDYQPWCAMFTTWSYILGLEEKGMMCDAFARGSRYAYVPYIVADARAGKHYLRTTDDPVPGDLVCYDWESNGEYDHVGLFEKWVTSPRTFTAIEGNTSTSSNSNGGEVMRRNRDRSAQSTVFVRVTN